MAIFFNPNKKREFVSSLKAGQCTHEMWGVSHKRNHELMENINTIVDKNFIPGKPEHIVIPNAYRDLLKFARNERERLYLVMELTKFIETAKTMPPDFDGAADFIEKLVNGQIGPGAEKSGLFSEKPKFTIKINKKNEE